MRAPDANDSHLASETAKRDPLFPVIPITGNSESFKIKHLAISMHLGPRQTLHLVVAPIRAPRAMAHASGRPEPKTRRSHPARGRPRAPSQFPPLNDMPKAVGWYKCRLVALTAALWAIYERLSLSVGLIRSSRRHSRPTGPLEACLRPSRAAPEPACRGTAAGVSQRP